MVKEASTLQYAESFHDSRYKYRGIQISIERAGANQNTAFTFVSGLPSYSGNVFY